MLCTIASWAYLLQLHQTMGSTEDHLAYLPSI